MIENILSIIIIGFVSLIPIVIWGYIFSYIDSSELSRKRFVVGLIGGAISVVPILFLDKLLESPGFSFLNIFEKVTQSGSLSGAFQFSLSLILFLFIIAGIAFMAISWTDKSKKMLRIYVKNIVIFSGFIIVLAVFVLLFSLIGVGTQTIQNSSQFGEIIFDTIKLIIFYYILIAFIEEASKHFNFLQSSVLHIKTIESGVLYAIFVALGFAFIENVLYLYSQYQLTGLSMELSSTYFSRSIFSVMLHVLCSAVVGYFFSKAHVNYFKKSFNWSYLKLLNIGLFFGVLLHLIFDLSITFGLSFMIIIYFIGGYLYVSSIFYKE
ncbi:PrsW family intramembrane metalloprotease [Candidatus Gracilibacteria bacterium]|nr:PrsW family intramembrane metalloprotease [Candidatus Gracilibacteria bacterium]